MDEPRILHYTELLDVEGKWNPAVSPARIPIHPNVYNPSRYSIEVCNQVLANLEKSIDDDLKIMWDVGGGSLPYRGGFDCEASVISGEKVEFSAGGARICISPLSGDERILRNRDELPQSLKYERAMNFSRNSAGLEIPSWYVDRKSADTLRDYDVLLPLRNAAILFNNLTVEVLKNEEIWYNC